MKKKSVPFILVIGSIAVISSPVLAQVEEVRFVPSIGFSSFGGIMFGGAVEEAMDNFVLSQSCSYAREIFTFSTPQENSLVISAEVGRKVFDGISGQAGIGLGYTQGITRGALIARDILTVQYETIEYRSVCVPIEFRVLKYFRNVGIGGTIVANVNYYQPFVGFLFCVSMGRLSDSEHRGGVRAQGKKSSCCRFQKKTIFCQTDCISLIIVVDLLMRRRNTMPTIFEYTDYHKYLADWFEEKQKSQPSFSYGLFAQKAGFIDKGFFHNVIHGKRDLTKESLVKVSQAIGHSKPEAEYFENLVFFNKASDLKERNYFHDKLNSVKSTDKAAVKARQTRKDQYAFYSQWYHSAIRSLIDMHPFKDDYKWLAKNVFPPVTTRQAKKSIELLESLGLIQKQRDKAYKLTNKSITTGNEIVTLAALNFHREAADLAKNALEKIPAGKRNITGLTLGISESTYRKICTEIQEFRSRIVELAEQDEKADRAYQLNFHFFPISNTDIKVKGDL